MIIANIVSSTFHATKLNTSIRRAGEASWPWSLGCNQNHDPGTRVDEVEGRSASISQGHERGNPHQREEDQLLSFKRHWTFDLMIEKVTARSRGGCLQCCSLTPFRRSFPLQLPCDQKPTAYVSKPLCCLSSGMDVIQLWSTCFGASGHGKRSGLSVRIYSACKTTVCSSNGVDSPSHTSETVNSKS